MLFPLHCPNNPKRDAAKEGPVFRTPLCHVTEPVLAPDKICLLALWSVRCVCVCRSAVVYPPPSLPPVPGPGPSSSLSGCSVVSFNSSVPSINLTSCKYESGKSEVLQSVPLDQPTDSKLFGCPLSQGGVLVPNFHCIVTFGYVFIGCKRLGPL